MGGIAQGGQLLIGHHAGAQEGNDNVENQYGKEADHRGAAHVAGTLGAAGDYHGSFNAGKRPHCGGGGRHDLLAKAHSALAAREVLHKGLEGEGAGKNNDDDQHQNGDNFCDGGNQVDRSGLLCAAEHQDNGNPPYHGHANDRRDVVSYTEQGQKLSYRGEQKCQKRDV